MIRNILSFAVGVLYIIVGIFVIVRKSFATPLEPMAAYALGGLLCAYGVFRLIRASLKLKQKKENE